ncbi:MAG: hypothetical protein AAF039_18010 [Bacteroidota bacterium]
MKRLIFIICIIGILSSCANDDSTNEEINELNVDILNTDVFNYNLGSFGDEEGVSIRTQATHFEISEINIDSETENHIYSYRPEINFVGTDYVEIRAAYGSDGASPNDFFIITRITFLIVE